MTVTTTSSHSWGEITNHTVSATNATSAPTLSAFFPGSINGLELIRADSLPHATIDPVNVTAPMKTPMKTSAWWIPSVPCAVSSAASAGSAPPSTSR